MLERTPQPENGPYFSRDGSSNYERMTVVAKRRGEDIGLSRYVYWEEVSFLRELLRRAVRCPLACRYAV